MKSLQKNGRNFFSLSFIFILLLAIVLLPIIETNLYPLNQKIEKETKFENEKISINNIIVYDTYVSDLYVCENRLFVSLDDSVFICDISDLFNPIILGRIDLVNSSIKKILGDNELIYIFTSENSTHLLKIYDISNPSDPIKLCQIYDGLAFYIPEVYPTMDVFLYNYNNQRYLVYSDPYFKILILNSTNPENPQRIEILDVSNFMENTTEYYISVSLNETSLFGFIYCSNITTNGVGFVKYDVSDFTDPKIQMNMTGELNSSILESRISFNKNLVILTSLPFYDVHCFRITNETTLVPLSNDTIIGWPQILLPYKNYIYRIIIGGGLQIFEINDNGLMSEIYDGFGFADYAIVYDDYLFLSSFVSRKGFQVDIYNASIPQNITYISTIEYARIPVKTKRWPLYLKIFSAPIGLVVLTAIVISIISIRNRKLRK